MRRGRAAPREFASGIKLGIHPLEFYSRIRVIVILTWRFSRDNIQPYG
jgi:hypothetical protein